MSDRSQTKTSELREQAEKILDAIGVARDDVRGGDLTVTSPIDGQPIAEMQRTSADELGNVTARAASAFETWRAVPAPVRGDVVRRFGEAMRRNKPALGELMTIEVGKIRSEALGEVQEVIDICDFAVGLSRQLYGLTIASERPEHHLVERWHPLGPAGIITAFNFPMAVWGWNAALALVCGDTLVWKPSERTPLCALACNTLLRDAIREAGFDAEGISAVVIGGAETAERLADDPRIKLISATGSTTMGRNIGVRTARRFAKTILELGGNAATIVMKSADLDMALDAIVFGAAGTAGQRCTTLRRVIAQTEVYDELVKRIDDAFTRIPVGDPRDEKTLVGPLIHGAALERMEEALEEAKTAGGTVHWGGRVGAEGFPGGCYVRPALVEMPEHTKIMEQETFAPLLYITPAKSIEEAIALNNTVPQGLSSSIFTTDLRESERFLSYCGSDCGIANVNVGTSGAEIGGAFGGEKETGGGRESGSDAWKGYMRRQTQTVNYSNKLPLAQGVEFRIG